MKFYNTLTRNIEEFSPLEAGKVRMYTCGPTVYDFAHIGNFRAYVFEDILRRHLESGGFDVVQVMNLTDVDDKTIKGANAKGISLDEYTRQYKDAFFQDLESLGIERAEFYPSATEHVEEMIKVVSVLVEKGYAYISEDNSVYFDVSAFEEYGKLAHLDTSALKAGARVSQDEYDKESVADFALWKSWTEADGNVKWDSPWGEGRPGWHVECTAMSWKYLGETFDIHTGGVDNIFPHHENEIAQSEAASGRQFVRYWLHCGYLIVNGRKMSKSEGNFYTLRQLLEKGYTGTEIRYVLLSAHYRQQLNFTLEACDAARSALGRIRDFQGALNDLADGSREEDNKPPAWAENGIKGFRHALDDDLNMPEALGSMFEMIREGNKAIRNGELDGQGALGALAILRKMDKVLGVMDRGEEIPEEVGSLVDERTEARKERDWARADEIRDRLKQMGWEVKDGPSGTQVRKLKK